MPIALPIAAALHCSGPATASAILDSNRVAMAPARPTGTVVSRYGYSGQGLAGEVRTSIDLAHGWFVSTQHAGIVSGASGFDGRSAWARDLSGFVRLQDSGGERARAISMAYRNANLWWRKDRGGARIEMIGCSGLRVTPRNGTAFEAWFDAASRLLARVREVRSFGTISETSFSAYRYTRAGRLPGRLDVVTGDDPSSRETLILQDSSLQPAALARAYAMPSARSSDWTLPRSGQTVLPFRLINNHIIVDAMVDGQGPFPFLVDTGGHDILTPSTIAALHLREQGTSPSSGAGEKAVSNGYTHVGKIEAGGATLTDQTVVTLDFSPEDVEGIRLGGMLGVEFLERFVVTIDYGNGALILRDPHRVASTERAGFGTGLPFRFYDHMPQVAGRVDGRPARFNIDTGARDELTLTRPFSEANDLRTSYPGGIVTTTGWGVGGPSRTYVVRARSVSIGNVHIAGPVVGLSTATRGSFNDAAYDGNVGSGLLKRFRTTFDYAHRIMYLDAIDHPDPDVGSFDRVGMWVNADRNGLRVMDILSGGPADQAGVKIGDVITTIDGRPSSNRSLSELRRSFKLAPVAKPITITLDRTGAPVTTTIRPRNLLPDLAAR